MDGKVASIGFDYQIQIRAIIKKNKPAHLLFCKIIDRNLAVQTPLNQIYEQRNQ
jgi:hypothetical protein